MPTDREILDNLDTLTEDLTLTVEERVARIVADGKWHTSKTVAEMIGASVRQCCDALNRVCNEKGKVKLGRNWYIRHRVKG